MEGIQDDGNYSDYEKSAAQENGSKRKRLRRLAKVDSGDEQNSNENGGKQQDKNYESYRRPVVVSFSNILKLFLN